MAGWKPAHPHSRARLLPGPACCSPLKVRWSLKSPRSASMSRDSIVALEFAAAPVTLNRISFLHLVGARIEREERVGRVLVADRAARAHDRHFFDRPNPPLTAVAPDMDNDQRDGAAGQHAAHNIGRHTALAGHALQILECGLYVRCVNGANTGMAGRSG